MMYQDLLPEAKCTHGFGFLDAVMGRGVALVRVLWRFRTGTGEMGIGLVGKSVYGFI